MQYYPSHLLTSALTLFLFFLLSHLGSANPYFRDVTDIMKLDFRHINGFSAERRLVETMGSGGALFDFDNDDDLDLYLVQGNSLSPSAEPLPKNRLYRNDTGVFVDITSVRKRWRYRLWTWCCCCGLQF